MLNRSEPAEQAVVKRMARRHGEEGHGGAWKVAFADFCLALLCLFLVMWLLAVRQQQEAESMLKAAGGSLLDEGRGRLSESLGGPRGSLIERQFPPSHGEQEGELRSATSLRDSRDVPGLRLVRTRYESDEHLAELGEVLVRLSEDAGLAGNLRWVVTPHGLRVMIHDTEKQGMFQRGSSVPTARFRDLLSRMGPLFARIENQMVIVGHTDSLPFVNASPTGMSNWTLSSDRALAARSLLIEGGMPVSSVLQVVGLADRSPLNPQDPTADENRRIELVILTEAQARTIQAMFGAPESAQPFIEGALTDVSDQSPLQALREQLWVTGR